MWAVAVGCLPASPQPGVRWLLNILCLVCWPLQGTPPCCLNDCSSSVFLLIELTPAPLKNTKNFSLIPIDDLCFLLLLGVGMTPILSIIFVHTPKQLFKSMNGTCISMAASFLCKKCILNKQARNQRCRMMMRRITSLLRASWSSCLSFSLRNTWMTGSWKKH